MQSVTTVVRRFLLSPLRKSFKVVAGTEKCIRAVPLKALKKTRQYFFAILPSTLLVVNAQDMSSKGDSRNLASVIQEADKHIAKYDFEKAFELLHPYKDEEDVELLWRLTKSAYEITRITNDKKKAKKMDTDGYQWIKRAIQMDDKHPEVHKMMAIMIDSYHKHQGVKSRVAHTRDVKAHMVRASELSPLDPHAYYMLGWWCYTVADMPWAQVQLVKLLFQTDLLSTFDEALQNFEKSLERDKENGRFYLMNLVMISKTHLKLGNKEAALKYLHQVKQHQVKTEVDKEACEEAATLLSQLGFSTDLNSCTNQPAD